MNQEYRYLLPLAILFILVLVFSLFATSLFSQWHIDRNVILAGNFLFLAITLVNYFIQAKGINNPNPNVFIRTISGGMLIKMVVILVSLFIYWKLSGKAFSKNAVFLCLAIFFLYFVTGIYCIMLLNKSKNA